MHEDVFRISAALSEDECRHEDVFRISAAVSGDVFRISAAVSEDVFGISATPAGTGSRVELGLKKKKGREGDNIFWGGDSLESLGKRRFGGGLVIFGERLGLAHVRVHVLSLVDNFVRFGRTVIRVAYSKTGECKDFKNMRFESIGANLRKSACACAVRNSARFGGMGIGLAYSKTGECQDFDDVGFVTMGVKYPNRK